MIFIKCRFYQYSKAVFKILRNKTVLKRRRERVRDMKMKNCVSHRPPRGMITLNHQGVQERGVREEKFFKKVNNLIK